jgi:hypothetical protein
MCVITAVTKCILPIATDQSCVETPAASGGSSGTNNNNNTTTTTTTTRRPGCDDESCLRAVCQIDSWCCSTRYNKNCVLIAQTLQNDVCSSSNNGTSDEIIIVENDEDDDDTRQSPGPTPAPTPLELVIDDVENVEEEEDGGDDHNLLYVNSL